VNRRYWLNLKKRCPGASVLNLIFDPILSSWLGPVKENLKGKGGVPRIPRGEALTLGELGRL
jgi:hypothetical protein